MRLFDKNNIFLFLLVILLLLTGLILAEGVYRLYLSYHLAIHLDQQSRNESEINTQKVRPITITVRSYPAVQIYNQKYGYDYFTGITIDTTIKNNEFISCYEYDQKSWSVDSISPENAEYFDADIKVLFLGSSYTATKDENEELATTVAARGLSKKTGRKVVILNMSRGAFGLLGMADLAKVKIDTYKPDLLIIAPNTPDLARPRWWPIFVPDYDGFYKYYLSRVPAPKTFTKENTLLHRYIFTDKMTVEWCQKMMSAKASGAEDVIKNDTLVNAILKYAKLHDTLREVPKLDPDLMSLNTSFLYNRLRYKDPYFSLDIYKAHNPMAPISVNDFTLDAQFMAAWEQIEQSNIPHYILHIPYVPEIEQNIEFAGGYGGVPKEQIDQLVLSIPRFYDNEIMSLLRYFGSPVDDASRFVQSATDWHPNEEGTRVISSGLEDIILKLFIENKIVSASVVQ